MPTFRQSKLVEGPESPEATNNARQWELQSVRWLFARKGGQSLGAVLLLVLACPAPRTTWLRASLQLPMTVTWALPHCLRWLCWDTGPLSQCGSAPLQVQAAANTNHVWASTPASRCFPWTARLSPSTTSCVLKTADGVFSRSLVMWPLDVAPSPFPPARLTHFPPGFPVLLTLGTTSFHSLRGGAWTSSLQGHRLQWTCLACLWSCWGRQPGVPTEGLGCCPALLQSLWGPSVTAPWLEAACGL